MSDDERFIRAIEAIDMANSEDPNIEEFEGVRYPKESLYAKRMTRWIEKLAPNASDVLKIAARAQHLRRWKVPRSDYPMTKAGYHQWRTFLYGFHAKMTGAILEAQGFEAEVIEDVQGLIRKKQLKKNPEAQLLEDAAALVFLENHFAEFSTRDDMDEEKLIVILQKTWAKMGEAGRAAALKLELSDTLAALVTKALSEA